jgi:choline dehydrogenase-like flavoprotein
MIEVLPEPEQPRHRRPPLPRPARQHAPGDLLQGPRLHDAGRGLRTAPVAAALPQLGAEDHTNYDPSDYGYVEFEGEGYRILGGNHLAGTHIMGTSPGTSVVDDNQRSWEHQNLYLVGGGSHADDRHGEHHPDHHRALPAYGSAPAP